MPVTSNTAPIRDPQTDDAGLASRSWVAWYQWVVDSIGTGGGGVGSVTSVALALPSGELTVSGSPVTNSGTLTAAWHTQAAASVFAGPATGVAAAPSFRALASTDIPALPYLGATAQATDSALLQGHNAAYFAVAAGSSSIVTLSGASATAGVWTFTNTIGGNIGGNAAGSSGSCTGNAATASALAVTSQAAYDLYYATASNTTGRIANSGTPGYVLTATATVPGWAAPGAATSIPVAASSVNPCWIGLWEAASGTLAGKTAGNLKVDPTTSTIIAGSWNAGKIIVTYPVTGEYAGTFTNMNGGGLGLRVRGGGAGSTSYAVLVTDAVYDVDLFKVWGNGSAMVAGAFSSGALSATVNDAGNFAAGISNQSSTGKGLYVTAGDATHATVDLYAYDNAPIARIYGDGHGTVAGSWGIGGGECSSPSRTDIPLPMNWLTRSPK